MGVCRISAVVHQRWDPFRNPEKPEGVSGRSLGQAQQQLLEFPGDHLHL